MYEQLLDAVYVSVVMACVEACWSEVLNGLLTDAFRCRQWHLNVVDGVQTWEMVEKNHSIARFQSSVLADAVNRSWSLDVGISTMAFDDVRPLSGAVNRGWRRQFERYWLSMLDFRYRPFLALERHQRPLMTFEPICNACWGIVENATLISDCWIYLCIQSKSE